MNYVAKDILSNYLLHYGMPRRSGRYPWGSGDNPYQRSGDWLSRVEEYRQQGLSEKEICEKLNLSSTELRAYISVAKAERDMLRVDTAKRLMEKEGMSRSEAARKIGINESTLRSLESRVEKGKLQAAEPTVELLKNEVEKNKFVDVGKGTENVLGISRERMNKALYIMTAEGYTLSERGVKQITNNSGNKTTMLILGPKGAKPGDFFNNPIHYVGEDNIKSRDGGETFEKAIVYPKSLDSSRIQIVYGDQGGADKDGVIELRRGVPDLSMGESTYSQARILVDDKMYLKGMAIYSDDLPEGVDVRFNTNKKSGTPVEKVLKPIQNDPDNPFGATIRDQTYYTDANGNKQLSVVNKKDMEGSWSEWKDRLPSQFLSKQPLELIKKQLNLAEKEKLQEYEEIKSLENPTIRKYYLNDFAGKCDTAAVELDAAALPRQKYQVILPINNIKDNEVFAPNFDDGETVALIRYPHGSTSEIPILKVNNKNAEGVKTIGVNTRDAVGINSTVAARLSGADFDGDFVMVIPCNNPSSKIKIISTDQFKGLEGFDPKLEYGPGTYEEGKIKYMTKAETQKQMGIVSNLITDMTLKGCTSDEEFSRAIRHSMVVIDAEKHKLDYKRSEKENGIQELKNRWQAQVDPETGRTHYGAATLISRSKGVVYVPDMKGQQVIDPETGKLSYKEGATQKTRTDWRTGKEVQVLKAVPAMSTVDDANLLSSGTPQETAYAIYANHMKNLANRARLDVINTPKLEYKAEAAKKYAEEVKSLKAKLNESKKSAPLQRNSLLLGYENLQERKAANPELATNKKEYKKAAQRAAEYGRKASGYSRGDFSIKITEKEWEAIQSGAISDTMLSEILRYSDRKVLRDWSMPKTSKGLSTGQVNRIKAMVASGYSNSEIAAAMNLSSSTVGNYVSELKSVEGRV